MVVQAVKQRLQYIKLGSKLGISYTKYFCGRGSANFILCQKVFCGHFCLSKGFRIEKMAEKHILCLKNETFAFWKSNYLTN